MTERDPAEFADVDRSADPAAFVRYLDGTNAVDVARDYKQLTFALLEVQDGDRVLDLGCGTGEDVQALAAMGAHAVGVDSSEAMIAEAAERATLPARYVLGNAYDLPFEEASFDACRADRVFQHLDDPQRALAELVRVCRDGGRIAVSEPDWGTVAVDASDRAVTRRLAEYFCDGLRNGWAGRRLRRLLKRCGVQDVAVTPVPVVLTNLAVADQMLDLTPTASRARDAGVISPSEHDAWVRELREAAEADELFVAFTGYIVSGRKP